MTRVLVVNRTRVNAEALASAFREEELSAGLVAASVTEARSVARALAPDIALLELDVAIGIKLVRDLLRDHPALRVFVYGSNEDGRELAAWAEAGATRIVMRTVPLTDLIRSVCEAARRGAAAHNGRTIVHRPTGVSIFVRAQAVGTADLTQRECDVLRLIAFGLSNREVAETLSLEIPTVKNHVQHLMRKLGVHRRADAARCWQAGYSGDEARQDHAVDASRELEDGRGIGFAGLSG